MDHNCLQKERILTLEIERTQMARDIDDIKKWQIQTNEKIDNLIVLLDSKFASKRVERVIKWMIWLILVTVFGAMLAQVIQKFN